MEGEESASLRKEIIWGAILTLIIFVGTSLAIAVGLIIPVYGNFFY